MATALDSYMPYDSGPGSNVSEAGWRKFAGAFRVDGIVTSAGNGFNVFGDSSGMQVKVDTGECWIQGAWGNVAAIKTLPIANNSSGSNRLDLVVLRNDFVNNLIVVDVLTGSSPTVLPTLTRNTSIWEVQLAVVTVPNGAVTISAANVGFFPQNNEFSLVSGSETVANNTNNTVSWDSWVLPSGDITLSTNTTYPRNNTSGVATNGTITFNRSGLWFLSFTSSGLKQPTVFNNLDAFRLRAPNDTGTIFLGSGSSPCLNDATMMRINAGTQLSLFLTQQTTGTQTYAASLRGAFIRI